MELIRIIMREIQNRKVREENSMHAPDMSRFRGD